MADETIADVLARHHEFGLFGGEFGCRCGMTFTDTRDRRAHVADAITAWLGARLASDAVTMRAAKSLHADAWHDADGECEDPSGCGATKADAAQATAALAAVRVSLGVDA